MARPHSTEPSSRLLTLFRSQFQDCGDAELAFIARVVSRGHAAHTATILSAGPPPSARRRPAWEKAKTRAIELDLAWSQLSTLFSMVDLQQEAEPGSTGHAISRRLLTEIGRLLFDPDCISAGTKLSDLLPAREHLPARLPEMLRPFYASAPPVRSRTRPPEGGSGAPISLH